MRISFLDVVAPKPYTGHTFRKQALGGTEGTVIKLSEALASRGHEITIVCPETKADAVVEGVLYSRNLPDTSQVVVTLRAPELVSVVSKALPNAKQVLWLHDNVNHTLNHHVPMLAKAGTTIVCVSDFHKHQTIEHIKVAHEGLSIRRIYNPVSDHLLPNDQSANYDANKLVFFSSPHKGLDRTLEVFKCFKYWDALKDMKLYLANPGYYKDAAVDADNIINLSQLPNHEVLDHVRSAFTVFHLNSVFPETFGIVYAEAHAVGTPCLTHSLGAVRELLSSNEIVDTKSNKAVIDTLIAWKKYGRPAVSLDPKFRMKAVVSEWERLFDVTVR